MDVYFQSATSVQPYLSHAPKKPEHCRPHFTISKPQSQFLRCKLKRFFNKNTIRATRISSLTSCLRVFVFNRRLTAPDPASPPTPSSYSPPASPSPSPESPDSSPPE